MSGAAAAISARRVGGRLGPRFPLPSPPLVSPRLPSTDVGWECSGALCSRAERGEGSEPSSSSTLVWNAAKFAEAAATRPVQHLQAVQRLLPALWHGTEMWISLVISEIRWRNERNWLCDSCICVIINVWAMKQKNWSTLLCYRVISGSCSCVAKCLCHLLTTWVMLKTVKLMLDCLFLSRNRANCKIKKVCKDILKLFRQYELFLLL